MKSEEHINFRDLLVIGIGIVGAIWFFWDLPSHQPISASSMNFSKDEAISKTEDLLKNWNFQSSSEVKRAVFTNYPSVIDSLQRRDGRISTVAQLKEKENLLPYFKWEIEHGAFEDNGGSSERVIGSNSDDRIFNSDFSFRFSEGGEVFEFEASPSVIKEQLPFNRAVIREGFLKGENNKAKEDSLVSCLVDYQSEETVGLNLFPAEGFACFSGILGTEDYEFPSPLLIESIWSLSSYYIDQSFWTSFDMQRDTLSFEVEDGVRYASATYQLAPDGLGISGSLTIDVLPAGSLKKMSLDIEDVKVVPRNNVEVQILLVLLYAFGLLIWLLIVFYLRIKAKIIDTKPALIMALFAGFLMPIAIIIGNFTADDITTANLNFPFIFGLLLQIGVTSALSSMLFFTITAVGDSVTRQFWPKKIESYDLIRRGFIKNKPIGRGIIRGISLGFFIAGIYSLLFWITDAPVLSGFQDISSITVLAPFASIFQSILFALAVCIITFLLIGSQFYASTKRAWPVYAVAVITFGLVQIPTSGVVDFWLTGIIWGAIGFTLSLVYVRTDFLTTAISFIVFTLLLNSYYGWIIEGSPEILLFYITLGLLGVAFMGGIYAIVKGEDQHTIPSYIPEYMEEIAQEQRVRQELQIARNVQKSFLPTYIPKFSGVDLAGMCDPAMETGGDYFDIIKLDDTCAAIAIGDVSGKGIQAAFYMTFAKGVIHSLCTEVNSATELLSKANKLFNDNATRGTFISMIYGILDSEKREFRYVRAGHNPILMKKTDGTTKWLQPKGVAIGMIKSDIYARVVDEECVKLDDVDSLILYTDGITEAMNPKNEFYGEERLEKLVQQANAKTSNDLKDIIIKDVTEFIDSAEQHDDMTLVVIKAN